MFSIIHCFRQSPLCFNIREIAYPFEAWSPCRREKYLCPRPIFPYNHCNVYRYEHRISDAEWAISFKVQTSIWNIFLQLFWSDLRAWWVNNCWSWRIRGLPSCILGQRSKQEQKRIESTWKSGKFPTKKFPRALFYLQYLSRENGLRTLFVTLATRALIIDLFFDLLRELNRRR